MLNIFKRFSFVIVMVTLLVSFQSGKLQAASGEIVCSTFPVYLFTKNIIKERKNYEVGLLINSTQGCPHDHLPTSAELERLSRADILIINGLGLEGFLPKIIRVAKADLKVVDASGRSATKGKKIILNREEMAQLSHDPAGPNPHIFASPDTAVDMVLNISEALSQLDPEGADFYRQNASLLVQDLKALAAAYKSAGETLGSPRIMASHGIFHYMARNMGLEIVATLEEVDGVDPSAARLVTLAKQARQEKVRAILTDPDGNIRLYQTLGSEANIQVVVVDPVAFGPPDAPLDYYQKVMLTDLEVIIKALSLPTGQK